MDSLASELLTIIGGGIATAAGIYAAIRSDLAALRVRADQAAKDASEAHCRIDSLLMNCNRAKDGRDR